MLSNTSSNSSDLAVSVRGLSKKYIIAHNAQQHTTVAEALMHKLKNPFQRIEKEEFWALRDIEFDIHRGEVVGIIGSNGAGKSTLLKILSQITAPTTGQVDIYGRVGSLLEVGTGFHPELTGRENIYLNGSILGMRRREIDRQFDAIVDFAEVAQFLDTPVKRYSSGMYVRLAFAVAAHLHPEILIVDEVLAVGDAAFQKKCLGKIGDVAGQEGRTVLFVSHNMHAVRNLCNRCILLSKGKIAFSGETDEAIERYEAAIDTSTASSRIGEFEAADWNDLQSHPQLKINKISLLDADGKNSMVFGSGEPMTIAINVSGLANFPTTHCGIKFRTGADTHVIHFNTRMKNLQIRGERQVHERLLLKIPRLPFTPGTYWFDVLLKDDNERLAFIQHAARFRVSAKDVYGTGYRFTQDEGFVYMNPEAEWILHGANPPLQSTDNAGLPINTAESRLEKDAIEAV